MTLILVTGTAGVGKSALLREFVIQSENSIDFAIHLRNLTPDEFVGRLADSMSLPFSRTSGGSANREILIRRCRELPGRLRSRPLIVVDSLDEAREHSTAIASLLGILGSGVDVIVGMRSGHDGLIGPLRAGIVIDLDSDEYFDPLDVAHFIRALLNAEAGQMSTEMRLTAEDAIQRAAGRNFLIAGLLTLARTQAYRSSEPWDDTSLPQNVAGAMRLFVERLPDPERAWDLLLPPALGLGEGWPVKLWATAATALTGTPSREEEIAAFRRTAAEYLIEQASAPDERTVRLYHDALTMTVQAERIDRSRSWAPDAESSRRGDHAYLARLLRSEIERIGWREAQPYIRSYLAAHAALGGKLGELLTDIEAICNVDPQRLQLAVSMAGLGSTPIALIHEYVVHLMGSDAAMNGTLLRLSALYHGFSDLAEQFSRFIPPNYPITEWFGSVKRPELRTSVGHTDWITAAAAFRADGGWLIATASADRSVQIWSPSTDSSRPVASLLGHTDCVRDVTVLGSDKWRLATASDDGSVRLWARQADGWIERKSLTGHTDWVRAVRSYSVNGRLRIVSSADDGTVRVWDPEAEDPIVRTLGGHTGWVLALCVVQTDAGPRILSGGADGKIFVWAPETNDEPVAELHHHSDAVRSVAAYERPDGWRIVSVGDDRRVCIWPFDRPADIQTLAQYPRSIRGVAPFRVPNGWAIITGCADQIVRVHELNEDDSIRGTQEETGHADWIRAVCPLQTPTGEDVALATGSDDGSLRIWRYKESALTFDKVYQNNKTWLRAAAAITRRGRQCMVAGGADGDIHFWFAGAGTEPVVSVPAHSGWVRALHVLSSTTATPDRLLSAGDDGYVCLWDIDEQGVLHRAAGWNLQSTVRALCSLREVSSNGAVEWIIAATDRAEVAMWKLSDKSVAAARYFRGATDWLRAVTAFQDGATWYIAAGGDDRKLRIWEAFGRTDVVTAEHGGHTNSIRALAALLVRDRMIVATTSDDGTVRTWDRAHGEQKRVQGHKASGLALCVVPRPNGTLLISASADQTIRGWDPLTLSMEFDIPTLTPNFGVVSIDGDGLLVSNQRGLLKISAPENSTE